MKGVIHLDAHRADRRSYGIGGGGATSVTVQSDIKSVNNQHYTAFTLWMEF